MDIYINISTYIFMYTHTYMCIYIHIHTYIYVYTHIHIYIYICIYTHVYIYIGLKWCTAGRNAEQKGRWISRFGDGNGLFLNKGLPSCPRAINGERNPSFRAGETHLYEKRHMSKKRDIYTYEKRHISMKETYLYEKRHISMKRDISL